jgi:hypothetical protein
MHRVLLPGYRAMDERRAIKTLLRVRASLEEDNGACRHG